MPWINYSVEHIANHSGLNPSVDFHLIYSGEDALDAFKAIRSENSTYEYSTIVLYCSGVI